MKNVKEAFTAFWHNTKLRTKIIIMFLVLLILPFFLFTAYSSRRIQSIMEKQTLISAQKTFDETYSSLEKSLNNMSFVSTALAYNSLVSNMISFDPDNYPVSTQYSDYRTLSTSISYLQQLSNVDRICLYLGDDYIYSNNQINFFSFEKAQSTTWFQRLADTPLAHWFSPLDYVDQPIQEQKYFSYMRLFYHPNNLSIPAAVLRIDVDQATFEQAISKSTITENSIMLLLDGNRPIISFSTNEHIAISDNLSDGLSSIPESQWETFSIDDEMYYIFHIALPHSPWRLMTLIPYSDIHTEGRNFAREMLFVMFLLIGIVCILAFFLTDSILSRISQLADSMKQIEYSNTDIRYTNTDKDEIGQLIAHFNRMMNRINQLMKEQVEYGKNIKNLELKALQEQINPHFLYNTLNTINCLAIQQNVPEITNVVSSLSTFYKISLSKGHEMIYIKEEITHAKMYLNILNSRYDNQIEVLWDISPELENLYIIKIVLQPIIENAAIHGIYEREDETGTIRVKGWAENEDVYITIEDNGIGMTPDVLEQNFSITNSAASPYNISDVSGGYGIRNIQDRLFIAYGADYGLSCQSTLGVGTIVTLHIPACRSDMLPPRKH